MNYVTTNIRIEEEDYLRLKAEAAKRRKSFSAIIRERIGFDTKGYSDAQVEAKMARINKVAKKLGKKLRGFDVVTSLREMRYKEAK